MILINILFHAFFYMPSKKSDLTIAVDRLYRIHIGRTSPVYCWILRWLSFFTPGRSFLKAYIVFVSPSCLRDIRHIWRRIPFGCHPNVMQTSRANQKIPDCACRRKMISVPSRQALGKRRDAWDSYSPLQGAGTLTGKLCWEQDLNLRRMTLLGIYILTFLAFIASTNDKLHKPTLQFRSHLHVALTCQFRHPSTYVFFIGCNK